MTQRDDSKEYVEKMAEYYAQTFRVKLDWIHGVDSVRAAILYGWIYIKQAKDGRWEIEINGELLKTRPNHKDEAMAHATKMLSNAVEHWLTVSTNAQDHFPHKEPRELTWVFKGYNSHRASTPFGFIDIEWTPTGDGYAIVHHLHRRVPTKDNLFLAEAKEEAQKYFDTIVNKALED